MYVILGTGGCNPLTSSGRAFKELVSRDVFLFCHLAESGPLVLEILEVNANLKDHMLKYFTKLSARSRVELLCNKENNVQYSYFKSYIQYSTVYVVPI